MFFTEFDAAEQVTGQNMVTKADRPEQIRALRRQGLSVSDICERIGVTRQTVWRHSKGIEPVPPTPTPTPSPTPDSNGQVDLEMAQSVGLGVLVDKAKGGSVSAAAHVFKAASAELRSNRCSNHISKDEVIAALLWQYDLWKTALKGPFCRRLMLEFDLDDPGQIEALVEGAINDITKELNARDQAEGNHG